MKKIILAVIVLCSFGYAQKELVFGAYPISGYSMFLNDGTTALDYSTWNSNSKVPRDVFAMSGTTSDVDSLMIVLPYSSNTKASEFDGWVDGWIWVDETTADIDSVKIEATPLNQWLIPITKAEFWAKFADNSDSTRVGPGVYTDMEFPGGEGYRLDLNTYDGKLAGWKLVVHVWGTTFAANVYVRLIAHK